MSSSACAESPLLVTALLFGPLLLGIFQQLATEPPARAWHHSLHKSPCRPPAFVFPLAWTWSYLSMGYASYLVYTDTTPSALRTAVTALYLLHHCLLNSWGPCFFVFRRMDYALNVLVALDVLVALLLVGVGAVLPFAAVLCLPYLFWLLELTYLNMYMFRNNDMATAAIARQTKAQIVAAHAAPVIDVLADAEDDSKED